MLRVNYESTPPGASLYQNGNYKGTTPIALFYTLKEEHLKSGTIKISPVTAKWNDGGSATTKWNEYNITQSRTQYAFLERKQLVVTYQSDPPGATIYSGGRNCGVAPQTLYYNIQEEYLSGDIYPCVEVEARWASGATTTVSPNRYNTREGLSWSRTLTRPSHAPGLEMDVNYYLSLENLKLEQQRERFDQEMMRQSQRREDKRLENEIRREKQRRDDEQLRELKNDLWDRALPAVRGR